MFGKIKDLMQAKAKAEVLKKSFEGMTITGESDNGEVVVTATGGRRITGIDINDSVFKVREKNEIETLVLLAVNNALEKSDRLMAEEMRKIMPEIPGLEDFKI